MGGGGAIRQHGIAARNRVLPEERAADTDVGASHLLCRQRCTAGTTEMRSLDCDGDVDHESLVAVHDLDLAVAVPGRVFLVVELE